MECEQTSLRIEKTFEKFTWKIQNFSKLDSKKLYSKTFSIGGYPWRILLYPNGNNVKCLSIYLDAVNPVNLPKGWTRDANFKLSLYNQVDCRKTLSKETQHRFNARESDWGFTYFVSLTEFRNPHNGFLVNDTCIIAGEVYVPRSGDENQVDQKAFPTAPITSEHHAGNMQVEVPLPEDNLKTAPISTFTCTKPVVAHEEMSSTLIGELVDFRGLGKIEKAYIPLLEEVCSQHPSLIECQQKRSPRFIGWAFTALGRVLHFLNTKRVKDMNEDACKELQTLWEELETFRFDLTWLEPHVQSALSMKNYLERAMQMEKLKENVIAVELETKRLRAKLAATEAELDVAKRDLSKASESLGGRDLDAKLGYGRA